MNTERDDQEHRRSMVELPEDGCDKCRLVREDGSEWVVTGLDLTTVPPRVSAVHPSLVADPEELQNDPSWGMARTLRLSRVELEEGDRLDWYGSDDEVRWTFRCQVGKEPSRGKASALG